MRAFILLLVVLSLVGCSADTAELIELRRSYPDVAAKIDQASAEDLEKMKTSFDMLSRMSDSPMMADAMKQVEDAAERTEPDSSAGVDVLKDPDALKLIRTVIGQRLD